MIGLLTLICASRVLFRAFCTIGTVLTTDPALDAENMLAPCIAALQSFCGPTSYMQSGQISKLAIRPARKSAIIGREATQCTILSAGLHKVSHVVTCKVDQRLWCDSLQGCNLV